MTLASSVAAVVLAAGRGLRFGPAQNKLLAELDGRPLLRRVVLAALASRARRAVVVTGRDREEIEAALAGLPLDFAHNPDFAGGIASSLRRGLAAVGDASGALVLLGDMPAVSPRALDALIETFEKAAPGCAAVVPVCRGKRGNPALLARSLFPALMRLEGDEGARRLLQSVDGVIEAAIDDDGVLADVDTPADLDLLRRRLR